MLRKIFLIILLLFLCKNAGADTEGGVTTQATQELGIQEKTAQFFNSYPLTSTSFVYNDDGGTSTADGWVNVSGYKTITITHTVSLWNSGTLTARIESQGGTTTTFGEIYTKDYGTTTSGPIALHAIGEVIPIQEGIKKVRVGWKVSSVTGSGTVSSDGFFRQ